MVMNEKVKIELTRGRDRVVEGSLLRTDGGKLIRVKSVIFRYKGRVIQA